MTSEFDLDDIDELNELNELESVDPEEIKSIVPDSKDNLITVIWGAAIALIIFLGIWLMLRMIVNGGDALDILSAMNDDDNTIAAQ